MTKVEEARRFALESACYTACRDFTPPNSCATNDGTGLWCSMCEDRKNTIAALEQAIRNEEATRRKKEITEALRAERVRCLEEVISRTCGDGNNYVSTVDKMLSEAREASGMVKDDAS